MYCEWELYEIVDWIKCSNWNEVQDTRGDWKEPEYRALKPNDSENKWKETGSKKVEKIMEKLKAELKVFY